MRYKIMEGSESAHCCFTHTVIDISIKPFPHISYFETVAECFSKEDAELVCKALNLMNNGIAAAQYHKYE